MSRIGTSSTVAALVYVPCTQEPPEDEANIIEKILAVRMVKKEVWPPALEDT